MTMNKSNIGVYPPYFEHYLSITKEENALVGLSNSLPNMTAYLNTLTAEQLDFAYAPGKWTIMELLLHLMDSERIFCYRALSIARGEKQAMIGFDENEYAANANAGRYQRDTIIRDYLLVRQNTIALFESFDPSVYSNAGIANGNPVSLTAIGFAILGHEQHHIQVLKERYGIG